MASSFFSIFRRNLLTPFVLVISILAACLLLLGQQTDAILLVSTIACNSIIGIVQETRAHAALKRLELLHRHPARRITHRGVRIISTDEIEVGDHLEIRAGEQIPGDGVILKATTFQVNESLITGEAREISRVTNNQVLGGSFCVTGEAIIRITAIGKNSRAGQMTQTLKQYEFRQTPLQKSLAKIIRFITYGAILASLLIIIDGRSSASPFSQIISTIIAGALTLVPEGLVLASTILFSYGSLHLSAKGLLVQRIASLEGFGRLEILCLDKTGTLTTRTPFLHSLIPIHPSNISQDLWALIKAEGEPSPTLKALKPAGSAPALRIIQRIPFSSSRKYSAVSYEDQRNWRSVALGAPEVIGEMATISASIQKQIDSFTEKGYRVLLLASFGTKKAILEDTLEHSGTITALAVLENTLRPGSSDAIFYLQAQGVRICLISGDALNTVQHVAKQLGIRNWQASLTGDQLAQMDTQTWEREVPKHTLFCRVLPEQKERLIHTFRKHGFTGMVGDGVNDALALKQSDLGVAMFEGSAATREVADVVLLDNDFASFPIAMRLASQIILGLEMVACLFFNKITYGVTILFISFLSNIPFPLYPRHVLLINIITIGIPSLFWSLAPPETSVRLDPRHFFQRVFSFSVLNGVISGIAIMAGTSFSLLLGAKQFSSLAALLTLILGMVSFWLIPRFLRAVKSKRSQQIEILYFSLVSLLLILILQVPSLAEFFQITPLFSGHWLIPLCIGVLAVLGQYRLVESKSPIHYRTIQQLLSRL